MFYIRGGEAPATAFLLCERRETSGFACGRVPFRSCEKEPKARLGRKRGFDVERKGRVLAHSVFPLRTPRRERFCGNAETADAARLPGKPVFPETLSALRGGRRSFYFYRPARGNRIHEAAGYR